MATSPRPASEGVDEDEAGDEWRRLQPRTEAARRRRPTEPGVEDHDRHQPEPEDRHRNADQGDDPGELIDGRSRLAAASTPRGMPTRMLIAIADTASSIVAGRWLAQVLGHGLLGGDRGAQVAVQHIPE